MPNGQPSILICDDDEAIRRLVSAVLLIDAYALRSSADAAGAIAALDESPADLVILDFNVSGEGGGQSVLHHIRGEPALDGTRVLMVTGRSEARVEGWGRSIGADAHLLKPFAVDELRGAVRDLLPGA